MKFLLILLTLVSAALGKDWWENGNFYQIYPRSFQDSNGDGIGDLIGITGRLDYLKAIGMDGVWLSPIFQSPMVDFGYDISDFRNVNPDYGTVADLEQLLAKAHSIGLHIILDFVPNHTSDEHEWFQRSVAGDPEYRDFYIWHDGVLNSTTGKRDPPSNWLSAFRYSAWQWNDQRQQYYLHQFSEKQADLNFRNPAVVQALNEVLVYWLEKGIDGFRVDAAPFFYEVEIDPKTGTYPDEPVIEDVASCPDPDDWCHLQHIYTQYWPDNLQTIYQWRTLLDDWKEQNGGDTKILMVEAYSTFDNMIALYGNESVKGAQIPFNFEFLPAITNQSSASDYSYYVSHWLDNLPEGAVANWVLGNHDNRRIASRFGVQRTDLVNILIQTLPGIAITYNGEEYGMQDVYVTWQETVDPQGCNTNPTIFDKYSRDPVRTPFRWDSSKNAGFSTANRTWLPVGPGYKTDNVEIQSQAENSHLKIFVRVVELRSEPAFRDGSYESIVIGDLFMYKRQANTGDGFLVLLNIGNDDVTLNLADHFDGVGAQVQIAVSSLQSGFQDGQVLSSSNFQLKAYNGYVLRLV